MGLGGVKERQQKSSFLKQLCFETISSRISGLEEITAMMVVIPHPCPLQWRWRLDATLDFLLTRTGSLFMYDKLKTFQRKAVFKILSVFFSMVMLVVFSAGCSDIGQYKKIDFSPPAEFLLGPEDILEIHVWHNKDLSRNVVVRPDGMISLPLIGDMQAAGMTASELSKTLASRLVEYMADPTVSVHVKQVNSYFVYVLGEVTKPGKLPLKSYTTVLQAISMAGGFTQFASKNNIKVIRVIKDGQYGPKEIRIPLEYDDLVSGSGTPGNFILMSGDTIIIP